MKSIGGLLRRGRPGEQQEFSAAFVIGAVNDALRTVVHIELADARATSFSRGNVVIGVSHGAVAGNIQRSAAAILEHANKKIAAVGGSSRSITNIVTRQQSLL